MIKIERSIARGFGTGGLYDILKQLQNMAVPLTHGNVYYVSKTGNSVDGLSWETAFSTIAAAITASNATVTWSGNLENNYIFIAPGLYAENLTSLPYYTHLIGLGVPGTTTPVIVYLTGGCAVAATTVLGTHIANMRFEADGAVDIVDLTTCNDSIFEDCTFCANDGSVVNGLSIESSTHLIVRNCKFFADTAGVGMSYGMYFGGGTALTYGDIVGNIITGCDPTGTGIYVHGNTISDDTTIRNNIIKLAGAGVGISIGQTGSGYKQAMVIDNRIMTLAGNGILAEEDRCLYNIWNNGTTCVTYPLLKVKTT